VHDGHGHEGAENSVGAAIEKCRTWRIFEIPQTAGIQLWGSPGGPGRVYASEGGFSEMWFPVLMP
jgi:hypothetical protein